MITFQLKEKNSGKESSVQLVLGNFFNDNKRLKLGIGISVTPEDFGTIEQLKKSRKPKSIELRNRMIIIEGSVLDTKYYFEQTGKLPSREEFRKVFDQKRIEKGILKSNKIKITQEVDEVNNKNLVTEFIEYYINDCEFLLNNNTPIVKKDTIKKYKSIFNHWLNFEEYKKKKYLFSDLTEDIVVELLQVSSKIKTGKIRLKVNNLKKTKPTFNQEGYSKQTIDNIADLFVGFVNKAASEGIKNNINLKSPKIKIKKAGRRKDYYIQEDILEKIIKSNPTTNLQQNAKDYIILAATTGMRYQSVQELANYKVEFVNIDGEELPIAKNIANKTDDETYSPVFKPALDIYFRNGNSFPKIYSLAYLNEGIRDLFKALKIKDKFNLNYNVFGAHKESTEELISEYISTHDLRSTFITNMLIHGVSRDIVKSMTHEHKKGDAFSLYDKTSSFDEVKNFYRSTKNLNSSIYYY